MSKNFLLLDGATPQVQAAIISDDGMPTFIESSAQVTADRITTLVAPLLERSHLTVDDCSGFIICEGPGSALGLRMALITAQSWQLFHQGPTSLLSYSSLDLALLLHPEMDQIAAPAAGGNIVLKTRASSAIQLFTKEEASSTSNVPFLNTKKTPSPLHKQVISYDIRHLSSSIFSICHPFSGELSPIGNSSFKTLQEQ